MRVLCVSSVLPRRCGIAHFNGSLIAELGSLGIDMRVLPVDDYSDRRAGAIRRHVKSDYRDEASRLGNVDLILLQHEYGLFGGPAGSYLLEFLRNVRMPVVTVFHTVLPHPEPAVWEVTKSLLRVSRRIVVMCETGADLIASVYRHDRSSVDVIPHGYPQLSREWIPPAIRALTPGAPVLLSLGLIGPNKGIELGLEALPLILKASPKAHYFGVGSTHPPELRDTDDPYRAFLERMVKERGVSKAVTFLDRYTELADHVGWIQHADVVILAHRDLRQVSSGTLAYAIGCRRPVVASRFAYASDVARAGAGVVLADLDARSIAKAVTSVLCNVSLQSTLAHRSNAFAMRTTWPVVARQYARMLAHAR